MVWVHYPTDKKFLITHVIVFFVDIISSVTCLLRPFS